MYKITNDYTIYNYGLWPSVYLWTFDNCKQNHVLYKFDGLEKTVIAEFREKH